MSIRNGFLIGMTLPLFFPENAGSFLQFAHIPGLVRWVLSQYPGYLVIHNDI
jgi:hypothetical protein